MKILIILAHPHRRSFNHAIAGVCLETLKAGGHQIFFHDLYDEAFDPLLTTGEFARNAPLPRIIGQHCREAEQAEGIIVIHPNWWGMPPAILKGWIDRVLRPGVAYEFVEGDNGEGIPNGLLRAETALIFNTSNTPAERESRVFGDPLEKLWKDCILDLCGVQSVYRKMFRIMVTSSEEQRKLWLAEVEHLVNLSFCS